MVNLFRPLPEQQGGLTAALLALLEHSDKALLNGLFKRAGIPFSAAPDTGLTIRFPAPDGPPGTGLIEGPDFQVAVSAQAPGEPWAPDALSGVAGVPLAISLTGQAPPGAHALSWEQVDRWLAAAAESYAPDSRTAFLIDQFRAVLPAVGIEYFAGFDAELLAAAPAALATTGRFFETAGHFFEGLGKAIGTVRPGAEQVRQARPEELLAGYCYRDYSDPALGATGFLRVALNLPEAQLQTACWLVPGGGAGSDAHARLGELLRTDPALRGALGRLRQQPVLWLWSAAGEQKLDLETLVPEALAELNWPQYHAGVQIGLPFADLPAEEVMGRVAAMVDGLTAALAPVLTGLLH